MKKLTSIEVDPRNLNFVLKELKKVVGIEFLDTRSQYEAFRFKYRNSTIIGYTSGKISFINESDIKTLIMGIIRKINEKEGGQENTIKASNQIITVRLKQELITKLKDEIEKSDFKVVGVKSSYEFCRFRFKNFYIIIYHSGAVVFKKNDNIISIIRKLLLESYKESDKILIGQDEAGKGEWWGPMAIASVALRIEDIVDLQILGITDSKRLNEPKINYLFKEIQRRAVGLRVIDIGPKRFNELFEQFHDEEKVLDDLLAWGHYKALSSLVVDTKESIAGCKVVIDEFNKIKTEERIKSLINKFQFKVIQQHKADITFPIVSAASICAKFVRNKLVKKLELKYKINFKEIDPKTILKLKDVSEIAKIAYLK
ncbi:MAG: hypothetical protein ACTSUC_00030 [Promethearchaeota archaeon]